MTDAEHIAALERHIEMLQRRCKWQQRRITELTSKPDRSARFKRAHKLIRSVAKTHGIDPELIYEADRSKSAVFVRSEAAYEVKQLGHSYPELGRIFGRDRSSVMNLVKKAERRRAASSNAELFRAAESGPDVENAGRRRR